MTDSEALRLIKKSFNDYLQLRSLLVMAIMPTIKKENRGKKKRMEILGEFMEVLDK